MRIGRLIAVPAVAFAIVAGLDAARAQSPTVVVYKSPT